MLTLSAMNNKHRKILEAVFSDPIKGNLEWRKIETLFITLGAETVEGNVSRIAFILNDEKLDVHRPHPGKKALRYRIKNARQFLINAGIKP